jgi:hypothetical protein
MSATRRNVLLGIAGVVGGAGGAGAEDAGAAKLLDGPGSPETIDVSLDYGRSFVTFITRGRGNQARLQVESRLMLFDGAGKLVDEYLQFASCKAEHTYAEKDLFQHPNYDFSGVFSRREFVIFRARLPDDGAYADRGLVAERFDGVAFHLLAAKTVEQRSAERIVSATRAGRPLIGRTRFHNTDRSTTAIIEYPVKTMNVNDQKMVYQVDTGPLVFPDFESAAGTMSERLELAFVAFNRRGEASFIVQRPTPVQKGGATVARVCHYSEIRRLPAENSIRAVE